MQKSVKESFEIETKSGEETVSCAARISSLLKAGDVIALKGDLGSGKTTFVRGIVKGLNGVSGDEVTSPTFVLMHEYYGKWPIYHMDSYRLKNAEDACAAGLEEFFYTDGIALVEWAERIEKLLPTPAFTIEFKVLGNTERGICFSGDTRRIEKIKQVLEHGSSRNKS